MDPIGQHLFFHTLVSPSSKSSAIYELWDTQTQRVAPTLEANVSSSVTANSSEADVVFWVGSKKRSVDFFSHPEKCAIFVGRMFFWKDVFLKFQLGVWFFVEGENVV